MVNLKPGKERKMELVLRNNFVGTDCLDMGGRELFLFKNRFAYTCEFSEKFAASTDKELTLIAVALSSDSLAEDWNSKEDEIWDKV